MTGPHGDMTLIEHLTNVANRLAAGFEPSQRDGDEPPETRCLSGYEAHIEDYPGGRH